MIEKIESFADRFKLLRRGRSFKALAAEFTEKTGVEITGSAMHKWENGYEIRSSNLKLLAKFFGVSEVWLRYGTGEGPSIDPRIKRELDKVEHDVGAVQNLVDAILEVNEQFIAADRSEEYKLTSSKIRQEIAKRRQKPGR